MLFVGKDRIPAVRHRACEGGEFRGKVGTEQGLLCRSAVAEQESQEREAAGSRLGRRGLTVVSGL